ncbi:unnamed protein product [Cuscuta epithymum]|uniref:Uncharacterized protein n=2 Tax=Cuscuta epithymum TaxID=186058 RepID=A0AAV0CYU2_9ASTE|nr:unnamed protein product [Cuscuta epithymum]
MDSKPCISQDVEIRKGPWTMEEDLILINYISSHGEGVWNSLARSAGLKRTGKSCRLRWLNYLRPDVRRGNITPEEQLLIMELHAKWGNRWSKIAKHLPGRTDNEIKNFWRTRIQKHMKHQQDGAAEEDQCMMMTEAGAPHQPPPQQSFSCYDHQLRPQNNNDDTACTSQASAGTSSCCMEYSPMSYTAAAASCCSSMDAAAATAFQHGTFPTESNDNMWSMEDLWNMQLLNGD